MEKRRQGAKTEPAFADSLHLKGDPYAALLEIHSLRRLAALPIARGERFGPAQLLSASGLRTLIGLPSSQASMSSIVPL